jgi:hypothetical protein
MCHEASSKAKIYFPLRQKIFSLKAKFIYP